MRKDSTLARAAGFTVINLHRLCDYTRSDEGPGAPTGQPAYEGL